MYVFSSIIIKYINLDHFEYIPKLWFNIEYIPKWIFLLLYKKHFIFRFDERHFKFLVFKSKKKKNPEPTESMKFAFILCNLNYVYNFRF